MAEPHDRCTFLGCTLGRAHVGPHVGAAFEGLESQPARQEMPAASPLASGMRLPTDDLDQYIIDVEAEARACDEDARSKQRRATELRAMAAHARHYRDSRGLRAWANPKAPPEPGGSTPDPST